MKNYVRNIFLLIFRATRSKDNFLRQKSNSKKVRDMSAMRTCHNVFLIFCPNIFMGLKNRKESDLHKITQKMHLKNAIYMYFCEKIVSELVLCFQ